MKPLPGEPPRIELARLPTPLVRLERLSGKLGGEVWLKRDDLTGLELSGNKVRKLEYVLADAQQLGCDTIVTEGTSQSNHCRATAAACARLGLGCMLLFRPPPPGGPPQGNHFLDSLFGAEWRSFERVEYAANREAVVESVLAELRATGRRPRWTPAGASEPLGCLGYLRGFGELSEQLRGAGITSADVVFAGSSGGTAAGLGLGGALDSAGDFRLRGICVSDNAEWHRQNLRTLCRAAIDAYELPIEPEAVQVDFDDGYVGPGYAQAYPAVFDAIRLVARLEAVVLDPVYTGKAFCALIDGVRQGRLGRERPVVFLHTGGIFSGFAWVGRFGE